MTSTWAPALLASYAAIIPADPAPTIRIGVSRVSSAATGAEASFSPSAKAIWLPPSRARESADAAEPFKKSLLEMFFTVLSS